jgi:hypothetical protein
MDFEPDGLEVNGNRDLFTASNGVKLRLVKVPRFVINDLAKDIKEPPVPQVFNEDKQRWEDNPLDPAYEEARKKFLNDVGELSVKIYFSLGTSLVSDNGLQGPEDDDWADALEEVGLTIPPKDKKRKRYLAWLKYYALSDEDQTNLMSAVMEFSGATSEKKVAEAEESFQGEPARDTAEGVSTP